MEEVLLLIEANQRWIFLLLGLLGLVYFGSVLRAYDRYRSAIYGLERERSISRLRRSGGMTGRRRNRIFDSDANRPGWH
jgi:hypothetical protein